MGQRSRPQSSGPGLLCAAARFGFAVLKINLSLLEDIDFTPTASATTKITMKSFFYFPDRVIFGDPYSSKIIEWRLRRLAPAAAVTTHAKPPAQQQLARDLGVERAAMGQRCRPQSSGPGLLCSAARFGFAVLKNNPSLLESLAFTPAASATTKITMKTFLTFRTE